MDVDEVAAELMQGGAKDALCSVPGAIGHDEDGFWELYIGHALH